MTPFPDVIAPPAPGARVPFAACAARVLSGVPARPARAGRGGLSPARATPPRRLAARAQVALLLGCLCWLVGAPASAAEHQPGDRDFRLPPGTTPAQTAIWIRQASSRHGLDPALVRAVMEIESGGDPQAVSPKGAQGLMQIMPGTARDLAMNDPFDPQESIDAGSRYLKAQLAAFGGDVRLALAAYNAGPEAVRKYGGVPPFPETQRYVGLVADRYIRLKTGGNLEAFVKKVLEGQAPGGGPEKGTGPGAGKGAGAKKP
ncbi:Soluble lytic murein transglycosylase [Fundidesulfovibrio magnetotacticus]|uniref:Soluble lytic murein transglycosylase n=1 Tax=Fundidesulfovibrio magnetotacticus TaxID=2730080 RepID=A0A6V8M2X6_9BACT|nr:lytic transglycosylase domain-containing protein [Fundidesulfovibrio magnetotacticus]GFK94795.1 Soluble lytic murein transglycosylase [Fundidesulfovibrio magnetotacticus]